MSEQQQKIIGKTVKCFSIYDNTIDISFTDNTKVYNLLGNTPFWQTFDEQGYPIYSDNKKRMPNLERVLNESKKSNGDT